MGVKEACRYAGLLFSTIVRRDLLLTRDGFRAIVNKRLGHFKRDTLSRRVVKLESCLHELPSVQQSERSLTRRLSMELDASKPVFGHQGTGHQDS